MEAHTELRKVFLHVGILRDRRGLGRCAVSERRSEKDLLQRLERIVGLCGENLVQCCHKVLPESVRVFDLSHVWIALARGEHASTPVFLNTLLPETPALATSDIQAPPRGEPH